MAEEASLTHDPNITAARDLVDEVRMQPVRDIVRRMGVPGMVPARVAAGNMSALGSATREAAMGNMSALGSAMRDAADGLRNAVERGNVAGEEFRRVASQYRWEPGPVLEESLVSVPSNEAAVIEATEGELMQQADEARRSILSSISEQIRERTEQQIFGGGDDEIRQAARRLARESPTTEDEAFVAMARGAMHGMSVSSMADILRGAASRGMSVGAAMEQMIGLQEHLLAGEERRIMYGDSSAAEPRGVLVARGRNRNDDVFDDVIVMPDEEGYELPRWETVQDTRNVRHAGIGEPHFAQGRYLREGEGEEMAAPLSGQNAVLRMSDGQSIELRNWSINLSVDTEPIGVQDGFETRVVGRRRAQISADVGAIVHNSQAVTLGELPEGSLGMTPLPRTWAVGDVVLIDWRTQTVDIIERVRQNGAIETKARAMSGSDAFRLGNVRAFVADRQIRDVAYYDVFGCTFARYVRRNGEVATGENGVPLLAKYTGRLRLVAIDSDDEIMLR